MSDKGQALLSEALTLDPDERRWLAETIFDSIDAEEDADGIALVTERLERLHRGEGRMIPFDEAMNSLRR